MPGANVNWPVPLQRLNPWYPGQFGVPGTDNVTGLRLNCTGKILYVDPNYPGTSDQRDGTDPTSPLTTIQAAVNKTTDYAGDVIVVMQNAAWQYAGGTVYTTGISEEVTLDRAGVRLVGVSPGGIGVPWSPASNAGTCLTVSAMDCCIEGFAFGEGAYAGANAIYAEWDGLTNFGENLVVRNCLFDDSVDTAIQLEYTWYCEIHHNWFIECDAYGIYVDPAGSGIAYCEIHHNWLLDCGTANLSLAGADRCKVHHNNIFSTAAQAAGVATNEGINTTGGSYNLVEHNTLSCLLPVPANGDYNDFCTAAATDAWVQNYCMDGPSVTNPT